MNLIRSVFLTFALAMLLIFSAGIALAADWKPVTPEELALKNPTVEKDADAEALFWEVRMDDSDMEVVALRHYVRVKIFTDRGRERFSKIDMVPDAGWKIEDVAARVIKPDGSIVELKKGDIFERTIVKSGDKKVKAKSFAVPAIEAGVIVEYRYSEVAEGGLNFMRFVFQRDIPVQTMSYYVKLARIGQDMQVQQFNMPKPVAPEKDKNGFYRMTLTNLPSLREEPVMPPDDEVRAWVMVFYTRDAEMTAEEFWKKQSPLLNDFLKDRIKPNDDVKRMAEQITAGAASPDEKLRKLYDYCVTKINNLSYDTVMPIAEKVKIKSGASPADVIKKQVAWGGDIDMLFGALAAGAGLESHVAWTGDRSELFFNRNMNNRRFIHPLGIAVKVGVDWRFFNPGLRFAPYGTLIWYEEGQDALVTSSKDVIWAKTPSAEPGANLRKRIAKLRLLEDGTLEGDVRMEFTGQLGLIRKLNNYDDSVAEQEKTLVDEIKSQMSTAELSDIKIENVNDPVKPFTYTFKVRVPGYASRVGKRLLLQPGFFEHGNKTTFTAAERRYDVTFHYAWSEDDDITIDLPAGFALDNAEQPAPITPEMTSGIAAQKIKISVTGDQKKLFYLRTFYFGAKGITYFPKTSYPSLKSLFEMFHTSDDHTIVLRQQ